MLAMPARVLDRAASWFPISALILLTVVVTFGGCNRAKQIEDTRHKSEEEQWKAQVAGFVEKYGAVKDWEASIPDRGLGNSPFSVDISRALISTNGRPVLLILDLNDVIEKEGKMRLRFGSQFFEKIDVELDAELTCSEELGQKVMQMHGGFQENHAVIARISAVSRASLKLSGSTDDGEAVVDANYSPAVFFVTGECIDVLERNSERNDATPTTHPGTVQETSRH